MKLVIPTIFCIFVASAAVAQPPDDVEAVYEITADTLTWRLGQMLDTLDVTVNSGVAVGGFNLKIASVAGSIDIVDIIRGDLPDSCGWEFFSSRWQGEMELGDRVLNYWTVVALPRLIADSADTQGPCFALDRDASLVRVIVASNEQRYRSIEQSPLFFVWDDCGDNTISSVSGGLLFMSDSVHWQISLPALPTGQEFPSVAGSPANCISAKAADRIKRRIRFNNGGLRFSDGP